MNASQYRRLAGQAITMSATSQKTAAAPAGTRAVLIGTLGQSGWVAVGVEPVAASGNIIVPTNQNLMLACSPGEKVAVLQAGTAGTISINFMG